MQIFSFCFIKDHPHLSRDLKKKRKNNVLVFINIQVSIGYAIDDHTYVFKTTSCVNTTELATIIGMLQTWWNFTNPLQQICNRDLIKVKKNKYYLKKQREIMREKKFKYVSNFLKRIISIFKLSWIKRNYISIVKSRNLREILFRKRSTLFYIKCIYVT